MPHGPEVHVQKMSSAPSCAHLDQNIQPMEFVDFLATQIFDSVQRFGLQTTRRRERVTMYQTMNKHQENAYKGLVHASSRRARADSDTHSKLMCVKA